MSLKATLTCLPFAVQAGIRTVQELLGHEDVKATMIYTHVLNRGGRGVKSPVDDLSRRPGVSGNHLSPRLRGAEVISLCHSKTFCDSL